MNKKKQPGQLRRIYDDVAQESVPDEFLKMLEEADKKQSSKPSGSDK